MIIRTETVSDFEEVYELNKLVFGRDDESKLIERIRLSKQFIPELSIVIEEQNGIIGHVLLSKAEVVENDVSYEVIVLAPIAINPKHQRKGLGSKLIQEAFSKCKELGYGLIFLIGHPTYYPRFGFKPARKYHFELKQFIVRDEVFMVCELFEGELNKVKGELIYPESFFS
jgi:putative acetyltransferase